MVPILIEVGNKVHGWGQICYSCGAARGLGSRIGKQVCKLLSFLDLGATIQRELWFTPRCGGFTTPNARPDASFGSRGARRESAPASGQLKTAGSGSATGHQKGLRRAENCMYIDAGQTRKFSVRLEEFRSH